jgi:hypothetical protein
MPHWGDNIHWDSGAHWSVSPPKKDKKNMANITINVSALTLLQKLSRGQDIITKSTDNPDVPGNATALAAFVSAQSALSAADAAVEAYRTAGAPLMSERDAALEQWLAALTGLAAITENATGGDETKILSAGFGVRGTRTPPQPVSQVLNVRVAYTGEPGHSEVRWKREVNSDAYVVQCCQDPITDEGWKYMGTTPEPKYVGNGAIPGKKCWYRVAGVNRIGQGVWSEPALRPVL